MRRGTRTHRRSRMRPPPSVEDVRRFFQSPVDAAPGTVVIVNTAAIARRSAAGYHHRTVRPRSTLASRKTARASARVSARPTSRSIGRTPDEGGYSQVEDTRKKRSKRKRWWWCSESVLGHALHVFLFRDLNSRCREFFLFRERFQTPPILRDLVARIVALSHPPETLRYRGKVTARSLRPQVRSAGERNHRAGASRGATPHLGSLSPRLRSKMRSAGTRSLRRQCGAAHVKRRD